MSNPKWAPQQLIDFAANPENIYASILPEHKSLNTKYPKNETEVASILISDERMKNFWEKLLKIDTNYEKTDLPLQLMRLLTRIFLFGPYLVDSFNNKKIKSDIEKLLSATKKLKGYLNLTEELNIEYVLRDIYYCNRVLVVNKEPGSDDSYRRVSLSEHLDNVVSMLEKVRNIKGYLTWEEKKPDERMMKFFIRRLHQFFYQTFRGQHDDLNLILVRVFLDDSEKVDFDFIRSRRSPKSANYPEIEDEIFLMSW